MWGHLLKDDEFDFRDFPLIETKEVTLSNGKKVHCVVAPGDTAYPSLHGMRSPKNQREWASQLVFILCATLARATDQLPFHSTSPMGCMTRRATDCCNMLLHKEAFGVHKEDPFQFLLKDFYTYILLGSPGPEAYFWSNYNVFKAAYLSDNLPPSSETSRLAYFKYFCRFTELNWDIVLDDPKIKNLELSVKDMFVEVPENGPPATSSKSKGEQYLKKVGRATSERKLKAMS